MKKSRVVGLSAVGVVFVLVVSACSGPSFNASGDYQGSAAATGSSPFPITMIITPSSTADQWNLTITAPGESDTGTCAHDPGGATGNLLCTFASGSATETFTGTLANNTYSGTYTQSGGGSGTFTATR